MAEYIVMPQLGESIVEGTVSKWLVKEGDPVKRYDPVLEVGSDKVDTEVTSTADGAILRIVVPEGKTVKAGTILAVVGQPGEAIGEIPAAIALHAAETTPAEAAPPSPPAITPVVARMAAEHNLDLMKIKGSGAGGRITKKDVLDYLAQRQAAEKVIELPPWEQPGSGDLFKPTDQFVKEVVSAKPEPRVPPQPGQKALAISPVVARLAAQHGVDLNAVRGSGAGGRITKKDILAFVEGRKTAPAAQPVPLATPVPPPSFIAPAPAAGEDEVVVPLTRMRRLIAEHMVLSKHTAPHATSVMEANLSKVVAHRAANKDAFAAKGVRLTFMPYFVQATVTALKAVPEMNSIFREDALVLKRRIHIGMAVAIPDGLMVPVLRDADEKNLLGLARTVNDLAERARLGKLSPGELGGSTFSITNHGTGGSLFAAPVINQPNVGILGIGIIQKRVVVIDDAIAIRPMVYLSLSFDHRAVDGAGADRFLLVVKETLENWTA